MAWKLCQYCNKLFSFILLEIWFPEGQSTELLHRDDEKINKEVKDVKSLCLWFQSFTSFPNVQALLLQLQLFVQKTNLKGPDLVRADALLSSRQEDSQRIWLKFWRNSGELVRDVVIGRLVTCYAVRTTIFNGQLELMNTDETSIEVTQWVSE